MNEKSRILIINYEFPPLGGGGGRAAYSFAKGFIQAGYQVDYLTSGFKGLKDFEVIDGISVYRVPVIGRNDLHAATMISLVSFPFMAFWQGVKLCMRSRYTCIHTHFVVPSGPLGFVLSKLFKIKHIISIHGGDIYDPTKKSSPHRHWFLRVIVSFLLNRADGIIAQSVSTKEQCNVYYKIFKQIDVLPLPYETISILPVQKEELHLSKNKRYVIGCGRLIQRKGFDLFIKMFSHLDVHTEGIILGDGPEKEHLQTLVRDLHLEDRITFTGFIPDKKKVLEYMSCGDVFVLSSLYEPFGVVLQDAMQAGLPIVTTVHGGQSDIVKDGYNGFLVDSSDEKVFAEKVSYILQNKEVAIAMKFNNLKTIKNFSTETIVKEFLTRYQLI